MSIFGYEFTTVLLRKSDDVYFGGDILFGGFIGWLIVDPFNDGTNILSLDDLNTGLGNVVLRGCSHSIWSRSVKSDLYEPGLCPAFA